MAEHALTTFCASLATRPPAIARRDIAAGGLAMLVLAAAAAGSAETVTPSAPDGELVALAAEFVRLQGLIDPLMKRFFELKDGDPELDIVAAKELALDAEQDDIIDRMRDIRAVTPAGLRAKASIARHLFVRFHSRDIADESFDQDDDFAWALINDIVGSTRV